MQLNCWIRGLIIGRTQQSRRYLNRQHLLCSSSIFCPFLKFAVRWYSLECCSTDALTGDRQPLFSAATNGTRLQSFPVRASVEVFPRTTSVYPVSLDAPTTRQLLVFYCFFEIFCFPPASVRFSVIIHRFITNKLSWVRVVWEYQPKSARVEMGIASKFKKIWGSRTKM
jgi:hypothetical protein